MTREEAIKRLKEIDIRDALQEDYDALYMAIEALEQEPCEDVISREPFTDSTICEGFSCDECSFNRKDKGGCILEERVMNLPSAKQEPKTIQEMQAESEKYQKAFEDGYEQGYAQARFDYEQEPCEDAISRQALINKAFSWNKHFTDSERCVSLTDIQNAPPVRPQEPKIGQWLAIGFDGYADGYPVVDLWECSECHEEHYGEEDTLTMYCPNCGAKMESEVEE